MDREQAARRGRARRSVEPFGQGDPVVRTLARVQRGLETLYRVDTGVAVDDFVIDDRGRAAFSPTRRPREQLLAYEDSGEMNLALYIDPGAAQSSYDRLGDHNLRDFLLVVEGVSHFIFTIVCG